MSEQQNMIPTQVTPDQPENRIAVPTMPVGVVRQADVARPSLLDPHFGRVEAFFLARLERIQDASHT